MFGLHSNADITYQINTAAGILDQILEVQPKDSAGGGKGESREGTVKRLAEDMLRWPACFLCLPSFYLPSRKLPDDYSPHEVKEAIEVLGGMQPMNIFLRSSCLLVQS